MVPIMDKRTHKPLISVVLPSYNDEPIILPYYEAITEAFARKNIASYELIYVDDGSKDASQATLAGIAERDPRVTFIELFRNFGQQRALFAGLKESRGQYVITLDGDYQYEPEVIFELMEAMGDDADLASGIRKKRMDNWLETVTSRIGNIIIQKALGVSVEDFGSVKMFSRSLVAEIVMREHYFSDVYPTALALCPKITQIPVAHRPRPVGVSHWNIWMRFKVYLDLYISYGDDHFFGMFRFGVLNIIGSGLFWVAILLYKFTLGHQATVVELTGVSFLWFMFGVFAASWSLTMSFLVRVYKQNTTKNSFVVKRVVRNKANEEQ